MNRRPFSGIWLKTRAAEWRVIDGNYWLNAIKVLEVDVR